MKLPLFVRSLPRSLGSLVLAGLVWFAALGAENARAIESWIVTTAVDEDNGTSDPGFGTGTSLREAINWANVDGLNSAITFSPTVFAAPRKTITLNGTQLLLISNGTISITAPPAGVEISGNNASRVFLVSGAVATLTGLTIRNGSAPGDNGGGVYNFGSILLLDSCTFTANTAAYGGAVLSVGNLSGLTTNVWNCTFSGNTATSSGGAVFNFDGLAVLDSCTVSGNSAPTGAGVATFGQTASITAVRNSIISANSNTDVDLVTGPGVAVFQSQGHNLIGDGNSTGVFNQAGDTTGNTDPGLAVLADYGGPTPTRALTLSSPARNTGNTTLAVDARGTARPQEGNDDRGAFEYALPLSLVVTTLADEDNGTSDPAFGTGTSLREAVNHANSDGGDSTITFDAAIFAAPRKSITLGSQLNLTGDGTLAITAPAAGVEISGNNANRIFAAIPGANVALTGLTIRNGSRPNLADPDGGAIQNRGTLLLDSCTLRENSARVRGGAIHSITDLSGVTLTIRNCTFSGNSASGLGSAIANMGGLTVIDSSTITNNGGVADGTLASEANAATRTELRNTIVSGNIRDIHFNSPGPNSFQSNGHNLIGTGNATGEFVESGDVTGVTEPGLGPLADNGGRTQTCAIVSAFSAARNTGSTTLMVDQRGLPRPRPAGFAADKGAFEADTAIESLVVTTLSDEDNGTSDPIAGTGTSLREAIRHANNDGVDSAITFEPGVFAAPRKTITLGGTELVVAANGALTITPPAAGLEISGNNASRVFSMNAGASVTLTGLTLRNGNVGGPGGAILNNAAYLLLDSCTFTANSAIDGGAIFSSNNLTGNSLTLQNCTLSGNSASQRGGGVYNSAGLVVIESSTIAGNAAPAGAGGGLASVGLASARTEVGNSIVSGNTNTDVDFVSGASNSFQSNGWNLIGDGNASAVFSQTDDVTGNADPGLAALADNGGPAPTRALLFASPARDTGASTLGGDQRGVARPQPAGYPADKGAFEFTPTESLVVTTDLHENDGTSDPRYGAGTSLAEAIAFANGDGVDSAVTFDPVAFAAPRKTITVAFLPDVIDNGSFSLTAPAAGLVLDLTFSGRIQFNSVADVTLTGLTLTGSTLEGAIVNVSSRLLLDSCTLSGNSGIVAGGIYNQGATDTPLTLRNCTVSGNNASSGGGAITNVSGLVIVESSTITGNTGPGGIAQANIGSPRVEVRNSIIAGNSNTDVDGGVFQSHGHNLIGDGAATGAFNQTGDAVIGDASPGLGPLQDNGGPTFTHAVLLGSPARNTGSTSLGTDQRGLSRALGGIADKGAYELQFETYAFWTSYRLPAGTPAPWLAPGADYDGDGIPNGLEQVTGRNPLVPEVPGGVVLLEIQGGNLVLQFERSILVDPAKISAEQSLELQLWSPLGITYQNLGPASSTTELIQALIPTGGAARKFGRLLYTP